MAHLTEKQIIEAVQNESDSRIFVYLYQKVFPKIRAFILKNGGDMDECRDIFQDALLVFCTKVKTGVYKHDTEIDGYLYAVSRNLWLNRFKIKNRKSSLPVEEVEAVIDDNMEKVMIWREKQHTLNALLEKIGGVCMDLLINVVYHKMSMTQVCEKMGFANENVAKTKNYKCKQRLVQLIDSNADLTDLFR